jgi:hypothetical protein
MNFISHHSSLIICPLESAAVKKFVAAFVFVLVACGKRGDPKPPVPVIPRATSDLVVAQRGANVILSWSYPSLTTAGQKLGDIRRIVVYRYVEELPVTQPPRDPNSLLPGDIDPTLPTAVGLFSKVPSLGPLQFGRVKQRIDSIESANLPAATVGARLMYEDSPQFHTTDGRPVRLTYGVVTEGATAKSNLSNLASIVPVDVPLPPEGLTATAKAEGVVLTWSAPQKTITSAEKPHVIGYNIYRVVNGQPFEELATPVNAAPIGQTTYTDVPSYGAFEYRITAVAAGGPPRIESDVSSPASATFRDLMPPPAPTGLAALVETRAVRLVWDAVEAPDFAGYKIYRTEGTGEQELKAVGKIPLTPQPITATNFRDTSVDPGISYFYEVTSVDKSGNESAPLKTNWVLVPKTP